MSNLYFKDIKFLLIDTEGILLTAGAELEVREPVNMKDTKITLKRTEFHGVDYEFSDAEVPLTFDGVKQEGTSYSGRDLLREVWTEKSVDGLVTFKIQEEGVDVFEAEVDFETYEEDHISVKVNVSRVNLSDKFTTRIDTPVNWQATKTADGTAMTPPTAEDVFLHGKVLRIGQKSSTESQEEDAQLPSIAGTGGNYNALIDFRSSNIPQTETKIADADQNVEELYGNSELLTGITAEITRFAQPQYRFTNAGRLTIRFTPDMRVTFPNLSPNNPITWAYRLYKNTVFVENMFTGTRPASDAATVTGTYENVLEIEKGDDVMFVLVFENMVDSTGDYNIETLSDHLMELTFDEVEESSYAQAYNLEEVMNHTVEWMTDQATAVESTFLAGELAKVRVTNGYNIRNFTTRNPIVSFEDMFDKFLMPVFGMGRAFVFDGAGTKILMERYERFYRPARVVLISEIIHKSYRVEVDDMVVFNQVETGYKEYPKSTDENKGNNLDEFNTKHKMLTPIERVKEKMTMISEVTTSGYLIENQRRQQFEDNSTESGRSDEDIFAIVTLDSDTYELKPNGLTGNPDLEIKPNGDLFLEGTFFAVQVGDTITIDTDTTSQIEGVAWNVFSVRIEGNKTVVRTQNTTLDQTYNGLWTAVISVSRRRAARDDEFASITNVISPETTYNVGLNPKYMLLNQSPLVNSGLAQKTSNEIIQTQRALLNQNMTCQFKAGEGGYTLSETAQVVSMNGDLPLSDMNQFGKLMTGRKYNFKAKIGYDVVQTIRRAYTDITDLNNYGYIAFINPFGETKEGYLQEMKYNPLNEEADFVIRERSTDVTLIEEYLHELVIGFGDSGAACATVETGTIYYSNTEVLDVGSQVYETSQEPSSILADGWVYDVANDRALQILDGVVFAIFDCDTPAPDVNLNYEFVDATGITTQNTTSVIIDLLQYGETSNPSINVGTDGFDIQVSLDVEQADIDAVSQFQDQDVAIQLEVYDGPNDTSPAIISLQQDQTGVPATISLLGLVLPADITGTEVFMRVTKLAVQPQ
jgi:hypothetical protein